MRLGILGPLEAIDDQGGPVPLGGARARLALAVLLVSANDVVSGESLASVLWPGREASDSRNAVQTQLSRLRRLLGGARLETVGSGYRLRLGTEELDALAFGAGAARAKAALDAGSFATAEAEAATALALWRGPALAGVADEGFARARAAELEERRLTTVECRTEARLALGGAAEVAAELGAVVADHPFRERLWGSAHGRPRQVRAWGARSPPSVRVRRRSGPARRALERRGSDRGSGRSPAPSLLWPA